MIYLQFSEIKQHHIECRWKVISIVLSPRAESFPFQNIKEIVFSADGSFNASAGNIIIGKWRLEYHSDIIPNPIIYFYFSNNENARRAMITRYAFMPEKYGEDKNNEMILYFSNGCEIVFEAIDS